jgi:hypothetical protein
MARATINTTQLARLLLMTPRNVQRLVGDGILARAADDDGVELRGRFEMVPNVQAYIKHLLARREHDAPSESRWMTLRNQRMAAEGALADLRLQELRGKLHRSDDVEFAVTTMITACRSRLLSIPSRIARSLLGKRSFKEIYDIIYKEIELALRELTGYDPKKFAGKSDKFLAQNGAGGNDDDNDDGNGSTSAR